MKTEVHADVTCFLTADMIDFDPQNLNHHNSLSFSSNFLLLQFVCPLFWSTCVVFQATKNHFCCVAAQLRYGNSICKLVTTSDKTTVRFSGLDEICACKLEAIGVWFGGFHSDLCSGEHIWFDSTLPRKKNERWRAMTWDERRAGLWWYRRGLCSPWTAQEFLNKYFCFWIVRGSRRLGMRMKHTSKSSRSWLAKKC